MSVQTKIVACFGSAIFEAKLNEAIDELEDRGCTIEDIQFSTAALPATTGPHFSALVCYLEKE